MELSRTFSINPVSKVVTVDHAAIARPGRHQAGSGVVRTASQERARRDAAANKTARNVRYMR